MAEYEKPSYAEAVSDRVKRGATKVVKALGKKIQETGIGVTLTERPSAGVTAAEEAAMGKRYNNQTTDSNN